MELREIDAFEVDSLLADEVLGDTDKDGFTVDNDLKAEWAVNKRSKIYAHYDRQIEDCDAMIAIYKAIKAKLERQKIRDTAYLDLLLHQYFDTVEHRQLKASEVYDLPSAKLVMKSHAPKFIPDDAKFVDWMKRNGWSAYIKVTERPNWDGFKKDHAVLHGGKIYDDNGVKVEGIEINEVPDSFEVIAK